MQLISMTDYVLEQKRPIPSADLHESDYYNQEYGVLQNICNYANFLKQPLKLEMFVPCDADGNVLNYEEIKQSVIDGTENWNIWENAKEKVLFEDLEIRENNKGEKVVLGDYTCFRVSELNGLTVEYLTKYSYIKLTDSAIKQIGICTQ